MPPSSMSDSGQRDVAKRYGTNRILIVDNEAAVPGPLGCGMTQETVEVVRHLNQAQAELDRGNSRIAGLLLEKAIEDLSARMLHRPF